MEEQNEQRLLSKLSLAELIKMKMKEEIQKEFANAKKPDKVKTKVITDLKEVPKELIFSNKTVYKTFNKQTKHETFINGIQAEGLIGLRNQLREEVLSGETDAFETDLLYVMFHQISI
jgi:hypothetical protein